MFLRCFTNPIIVCLLLVCRYLSLVRLFGFLQLFLHLSCSLSEEKSDVQVSLYRCVSAREAHKCPLHIAYCHNVFGDTLREQLTYSCWVLPWPTRCFCLLYLTSLLSACAPSPPLSAACERTRSSTSCTTTITCICSSNIYPCLYLCSLSSFSWYISVIMWSFCCNLWTCTRQEEKFIQKKINVEQQYNKISPLIHGWGQLPDLRTAQCPTAEILSHYPSP